CDVYVCCRLFTFYLAQDGTFVFFFSSRRRHTRFKCDWSSDVCSSDLQAIKFENRKINSDLRKNFLFDRDAQLELHLVMRRCNHFRKTRNTIGHNIKSLANFYSEHAEKVGRIRPQQKSAMAFHAVGDPAAARHPRRSIT